MKYVKDLIPKNYRVNLSKYQSYANKASQSKQEKITSAIAWIICFIAVGIFFSRFAVGLILLMISIFLHRRTSYKIEKIFRFSLTTRIKKVLVGFLLLLSIPINLHYVHIEGIAAVLKKETDEKELIAERKKKEEAKLLSDKVESLKSLGRIELQKKHYTKALYYFDQCIVMNAASSDDVSCDKGICFYNLSKYDSAITCFERCKDADSYLWIGKCYEKQRKTLLALKYYKLDTTGEGEKLYNKLNPIKRRILYYQTICCDGTESPSNAKGRGACSHHGGVCNWNKPIYQEYREFEE